jgi:hypothetical protein
MPRSGHMLKDGRDFDEEAFTRVVSLLALGLMVFGLPPSVKIYFAREC